MKRTLSVHLDTWLSSPDRKPLVLRGVRQVGKTWLVRHLAKVSEKKLIELNFEKNPAYASFFSSNDPQQILRNLSTVVNEKIDSNNSILFLDEIQVVPQLFSKLRWFAEDLPALPVVAAGSLLEFVITDHSFSMPVGRISYMHLEPMSFAEFLLAKSEKALFSFLQEFDFKEEVPIAIHQQLLNLFKEYLLIGGLPAVVSSWIKENSLNKVQQIQHDLLATYRDDFAKYKGRIAIERLDEVMMAVPRMLGYKFVYSHVNKNSSSTTIKQALNLLEKARVCHSVRSTAANGIPLGAEVKEKYFKEIFLDVGLCSISLGLSLNQLNKVAEIALINSGSVAEQVVGQLLRTIEQPYIEPALYCWHRDEPGSNAEIDYVMQHRNQIIPIEVKAGSTGSLKSLHLFMGLKGLSLALRINSDLPSKTSVKTTNALSQNVNYKLLSLPFYLIEQSHRLIDLNDDKQ